jgi:competence protein ComFC
MCQACGLPLGKPGMCPACNTERPPFIALRSWLVFEGPIRRALHTLKYRRNLALGDTLAQEMAGYVRALGWQVDLLIPVPLGRDRMKERGYNQVGLVGAPLAVILNWRYRPAGLERARETRSQVGLSADERKENVSGAFRADARLVGGRSVVIMDDVATTGATLAACADTLLRSGARTVYALTLARALPHRSLQVV